MIDDGQLVVSKWKVLVSFNIKSKRNLKCIIETRWNHSVFEVITHNSFRNLEWLLGHFKKICHFQSYFQPYQNYLNKDRYPFLSFLAQLSRDNTTFRYKQSFWKHHNFLQLGTILSDKEPILEPTWEHNDIIEWTQLVHNIQTACSSAASIVHKSYFNFQKRLAPLAPVNDKKQELFFRALTT